MPHDVFEEDIVPGGGGGGSLVAYDAAVLTDVPVGYWPLDELTGTAALDLSLNANNGTYVGAVVLGSTPGPCTDGKTAANMNGAAYVTVPHSSQLAIVGPLTIEMWVNPTSWADYYWLAGKQSGTSANPFSMQVGAYGQVFARAGGLETFTGGSPPLGVWTHVVIADTQSGVGVTLYYNGLPINVQSSPAAPTDGGTPLLIGTRPDLYSKLHSAVAKVAIYARALTPQQVLAHYLSGIGH